MKEIGNNTDNSGPVLVVTVQPSNSRSVSPLTPSPSREIRGLRLFRAISRKLGRRSNNEDSNSNGEDDSRSSSTDSCSSTSTSRCSRTKKSESDEHSSSACGSATNLNYRSHSPHHNIMSSSNSSSNGSETGSETHEKPSVRHRHHHSTTAATLRKAFGNLTLSTRSQSCDNTAGNQTSSNSKESKRTSKKSAPKRILRPPVTYTYVRGLSGLPTQRVPRSSNTHYYSRLPNGNCYCGHQYLTSVNRY